MKYISIILLAVLFSCQSKTVEDYLKLYETAYAEENYQEAVKMLNHAIQLDNQNLNLYVLRSDVYNKLLDYANAVEDLNFVINSGGGDEITLYNRGVYNLELEEYDLAIKDFETLYSDTKDNKYLFYIGQSLYLNDKYKQAIIYLNDVISLDDKNASAYNYRACCKWAINDKETACTDWIKAAELGEEEAIANIEKYCAAENKVEE